MRSRTHLQRKAAAQGFARADRDWHRLPGPLQVKVHESGQDFDAIGGGPRRARLRILSERRIREPNAPSPLQRRSRATFSLGPPRIPGLATRRGEMQRICQHERSITSRSAGRYERAHWHDEAPRARSERQHPTLPNCLPWSRMDAERRRGWTPRHMAGTRTLTRGRALTGGARWLKSRATRRGQMQRRARQCAARADSG